LSEEEEGTRDEGVETRRGDSGFRIPDSGRKNKETRKRIGGISLDPFFFLKPDA
jgi:hypothetical protein